VVQNEGSDYHSFPAGGHSLRGLPGQRGRERQLPYDIVEDIEVDSWEEWQKTVAGPGMAQIVKDWDNYGDGSTMVMIYADKIK